MDTQLAVLARHGVVKVAHLRAVGLNGTAVSKRRKRGVLHLVHPGVYAIGHATLSLEGRWLAAVYTGGDGAVLGRLAAGALWRAWKYPPREIDVLVPRSHRPVDGIRFHKCRRLDPRDVTEYLGIPVTTVARTLVDLTDVLTANRLANVIHEAAYRKRFSLEATRQAMQRANGRHNLHVLEEAIEAHLAGSAGTKSGPEDQYVALIQAAGLPKPLTNTHVLGFEVDNLWPDQMLVVEVDGPGHERPRSRREDRERDVILTASGYTVLRFTDVEVEWCPDDVVASTSRSLRGIPIHAACESG